MPRYYEDNDIRAVIHNKVNYRDLWHEVECLNNKCREEKQSIGATIRRDALVSFNELASIINGEQQNLYIKERLDRLQLHSVFISGMPESKDRIEMISRQLGLLQENVQKIKKSFKSYGTNVQLSYRLAKLNSDVALAGYILRLCHPEVKIEEIQEILEELIRIERENNKISHFIKSKLKILTRTIVEHNTNTGGKYIADNRKEYYKILWASIIGGFFIAIFALFKIYIESWGFSLLGEGLLFGLNYALCFILVDLLGGIIATKQPAMTANTFLSKVVIYDDKRKTRKRIAGLVADVSKSQFISFVGNLSLAFIFSYAVSKIYVLITGESLFEQDKAKYLLDKNNISISLALLYAAIAGVFLSLSGFIAGYFDNAVLYFQLQKRIDKNYADRKSLSVFYGGLIKRLGKLFGSISLGFFLGLSGAIGLFSGIPFDIRHVAFSSSHIAYGSQVSDMSWFSQLGLVMCLSIFTIGLVNFLVSFLITMVVALKAKDLKMKDILMGFLYAIKVLILKPWIFILPKGFNYFK